MKRKPYSLVIFLLLFSGFAFAQTKVLTTDGKILNANSVMKNDDSIITNYNGEIQSLLKSNVLAIVPHGKSPYTFKFKNCKKLNIKKKFIRFDYTGTDKPRLFAYKYMGSRPNVSQLYVLNSDASITEEQFKSVFHAQQSKLRTNDIVSVGLASFAFLLLYSSLKSTLNQVKQLNDLSKSMN